MALVLNGSGTVTGISVGGLPDGIVDSGTLATNSVDSAELIDGAVDNSHIDALAASKLTGALPAIDGSALTNLVQQDPTTLSYVGLDSAAHHNIGSFAIDSRGRYRISVDIRLGYTTQSGFITMYLGTSSGGGKIGNARLVSENMTGSGVNLGLTFHWVMDFGTSLSYPYTVYATIQNSSAGSSQIFTQSDYNGIPVVSCLKIADITTATGFVAFGS